MTSPREPQLKKLFVYATWKLWACAGFLFAAPHTFSAKAQENLKYSAAGPYAAGAFDSITVSQSDYNVKLGPILFNMDAGVGVGYNDNINLAQEGQISDGFVRPEVGIAGYWQVTELNSLAVNIDLAFTKYFNTPQADTQSILIAPGSDLSFDFYVSDFKITLFDTFSLQQDPTQEIQLADVINFTRFQNTTGINVLWDLNDLDIEFGYGYSIFRALQNEFDFTSRNSSLGWLSATFQINPALEAGFGVSMQTNQYSDNFLNNSTYWQIGPFVEWQASPFITLAASAGVQLGTFQDSGLVGDGSELFSPYGQLGIVHQINPYVTSAVNVGFSSQVGLTTNFYNLAYVEQEFSWRILKDVDLNTLVFYENAGESGGILAENINRWGAGLGIGYAVNEHLVLDLSYRYISRDSNLPQRDYDQNVVYLDINYRF